MPFALPYQARVFLADCTLSRKLTCPTLAGRPIAAQYGVYALSCSYNSTTVAPTTADTAHDRSTVGRLRARRRPPRDARRARGGTALAAGARQQAKTGRTGQEVRHRR